MFNNNDTSYSAYDVLGTVYFTYYFKTVAFFSVLEGTSVQI